MVIQSSADDVPLQEDIEAACVRLLDKFRTFLGGARQLRSIPSYALPFDMALAAANGCSLLSGLELKDPSLLTLLGELARAPHFQVQATSGAEMEAFSFLAGLVLARASKVCSGSGFVPGSLTIQGADFALGDAVEFDNAGAITDGRVVLLEEDQALVRETMNGRIRIVKHRDLFPPGSRQAMAHHRALLGLAHDAGAVEATKAFRRLAKQHHPDKGGDPEMFRRLRVAFEALTLSTSTAVEKSPSRSAAKSKPSKASDADSPRTPEGPRRRLRQKTPPEGMRKDRPVPDMEGPAPKRHCRRERTKHTAADDKKEGEVAQELTVNGIMQLIWLFAVGPKSHA